MKRDSFTLIELLMVMAIIAVIAVVAVFIINPLTILQRERDTARLSDMGTIGDAMSHYKLEGSSLGTAQTLYVSIPDPLATSTAGDQCQGTGLSTSSLPSGWVYHCAGLANFRNGDGTGWIPINFNSVSDSPLTVLPIDPINTTSSGYYYTYATDGTSWEGTMILESSKYIPQEGTDQGLDPAMYEVGSNLAISPFARGLVGYWKFDDGSGTTAADSSGFGNTGTLYNSPIWTTGRFNGALAFNGTSSYVRTDSYLGLTAAAGMSFTWSFWLNTTSTDMKGVLGWGAYRHCDINVVGGSNKIFCDANSGLSTIGSTAIVNDNAWHNVAWVYAAGIANIYVDGALNATMPRDISTLVPNDYLWIGKVNFGRYFPGSLDGARIYNRALTDAEVANLYANP